MCLDISDSDVLHDLVPCVQFKKRENRPWRSETFGEVVGITTGSFKRSCKLKKAIYKVVC